MRTADVPNEAAGPGGSGPGPGNASSSTTPTRTVFSGNWFEGCAIGVHFTAGSERNSITGNAFISNRTQVKYVGTRYLDWSREGRGNYWSDNPAFDLNGDGIADEAYRPERHGGPRRCGPLRPPSCCSTARQCR